MPTVTVMVGEFLSDIKYADAGPSVHTQGRQGEVVGGDGYRVAVVFDQTGIDPQTGVLPAGIDAQTEQAVKNVVTLLGTVEAEPGNVFKVDVNVANANVFPGFSGAYQRSPLVEQRVLPTRFTVVQEPEVPGALVTVSASAAFRSRSAKEQPVIEAITTPDAPTLAGLSQGVIIRGRNHDTVLTSGQIGLVPRGDLIPGGVKQESGRIIDSIKAIFTAGGATFGHMNTLDVVTTNQSNRDGVLTVLTQRGLTASQRVSRTYSEAGLLKNAAVEMRAGAQVPVNRPK